MLMEEHMNGAQVGPTAGCIIAEQFVALKKGITIKIVTSQQYFWSLSIDKLIILIKIDSRWSILAWKRWCP